MPDNIKMSLSNAIQLGVVLAGCFLGYMGVSAKSDANRQLIKSEIARGDRQDVDIKDLFELDHKKELRIQRTEDKYDNILRNQRDIIDFIKSFDYKKPAKIGG